MNFKTVACLSLILFAITLIGGAQEESVRNIHFRGICFGMPNGSFPKIYAHDPAIDEVGTEVVVRSYLNHESATIKTKGGSIVFTTSPQFSSIGNPAELLSKTTVGKGIERAIFVFLPGPDKNANRMSSLVIDDSRKAFPQGSIMVFNLSPHLVRMSLEKTLFDFTPGERELIENPPKNERSMAAMGAYQRSEGKWLKFASSRWAISSTTRSVQIIYFNAKGNRIEMNEIPDNSVPDAEPQAPAE